MQITKDTIIKDIIKKHPKVAKIFLKNNIHCITCPITIASTIEEAVKNKNINIENLIAEIQNNMEDKDEN